MLINTCCGYESEIAYDLCPECHEHCDWKDLDEEEIAKDQKEQNEMDEQMLREAEEKLHNQ